MLFSILVLGAVVIYVFFAYVLVHMCVDACAHVHFCQLFLYHIGTCLHGFLVMSPAKVCVAIVSVQLFIVREGRHPKPWRLRPIEFACCARCLVCSFTAGAAFARIFFVRLWWTLAFAAIVVCRHMCEDAFSVVVTHCR